MECPGHDSTFDSEGKPGNVRYFLAYEPDKERAVELVRKRVPVNKGEEAEAVAEVPSGSHVEKYLPVLRKSRRLGKTAAFPGMLPVL